jgi:hypothetical protein
VPFAEGAELVQGRGHPSSEKAKPITNGRAAGFTLKNEVATAADDRLPPSKDYITG